MKKFMKFLSLIWKLILGGILTLIILIVISAFMMNQQTKSITSISSYRKVLQKSWQDSKLTQHFPKIIPEVSKNESFFYQPGFLQGGSSIELLLEMPDEFIKKEIEKYKEISKFTFAADKEVDGVPKLHFYSFSNPEDDRPRSLPTDFQIYLLYLNPTGGNQIPWNHGQRFGVSISKERNQIIYWAESW